MWSQPNDGLWSWRADLLQTEQHQAHSTGVPAACKQLKTPRSKRTLSSRNACEACQYATQVHDAGLAGSLRHGARPRGAGPAHNRHSVTFVLSPPVDNLSSSGASQVQRCSGATGGHRRRMVQSCAAAEQQGSIAGGRCRAVQQEPRAPGCACAGGASRPAPQRHIGAHQPQLELSHDALAWCCPPFTTSCREGMIGAHQSHLQLSHDALAQQGGVVHNAQGGDEGEVAPLVARHGPHVALQAGSASTQAVSNVQGGDEGEVAPLVTGNGRKERVRQSMVVGTPQHCRHMRERWVLNGTSACTHLHALERLLAVLGGTVSQCHARSLGAVLHTGKCRAAGAQPIKVFSQWLQRRAGEHAAHHVLLCIMHSSESHRLCLSHSQAAVGRR